MMIPLLPIPELQPIPLPGPLWLLQTALVVGFFMHAIPMNVALVGGLVAGLFLVAGVARNHTYSIRLGNALAYSLPFFVSFAITFGIVPLLFLQLVYGPLFYTSSVIIATPWLLVIFLLLTGYYGLYVYNYKRSRLAGRAPWLLISISLLFLCIAFFFSNNMTLMLTPERWAPLYNHDPHGLNLNWGESQLLPRYLHFVAAAFAVTSLLIGSFGIYWHSRDQEYGQWLIRTGAMLFILVTLLQFPIGIWFMLALPQAVMMNFLGHDPLGTTIFVAAMVGDVVGLSAMFIAGQSGRPWPFRIGVAVTLGVIFLMVMMRHLVRVYMTQPFFRPETFAQEPQWELILLFAAGAILLMAYLLWLARLAWKAFHPVSSMKPV